MKKIMVTLAAMTAMALGPPSAASATEADSYYDSGGATCATTLEVIGAAAAVPVGDQVKYDSPLDRGPIDVYAIDGGGGVDVPLAPAPAGAFKLTDADIVQASADGATAFDRAGHADDG